MSHPKDSEGNVFMIGDIVVWSRDSRVIGKGIVQKLYSKKEWNYETKKCDLSCPRVAVKAIDGNGITTLYKPNRALIISRAAA